MAAPVSPNKAPGAAPGEGRIVVTGGAGFLGSNLVANLASQGEDVLIVDTLARPRVEENLNWLKERHGNRIAFERSDVRDAGKMAEAIRGAKAVVHLAAQVAVTTSVTDPVSDFEINARGTLNVLEAVRNGAPDAPVLFASTNKVYGKLMDLDAMKQEGERYVPRDPAFDKGLDETTPLAFYSPYGCSKGVADQYVLDYGRVYGLKTAVFRMSCLYGPRQFGTEDQGWVAHFLIAALTGRKITLYGDGYQVRDILYVDDAVNAYTRALADIDSMAGQAFNLGGGPANTVSLRELLSLIADITGVKPVTDFDEWRPGDQPWYVSNTDHLSRTSGWRAETSVRDGLSKLQSWLGTAFEAQGAAKRELRA
ncbi:CDP-paratose 2-epimerase [Faunimonas pinastri]|uniref:CDP-paratose 2-epimerase n=1 Tax=Faunimonas pinastri TaxID=1855383 RepID=A0A1H9JXG0_9HYPH|nr:NAD-dependent epimerase/dehydratase family protein [Faunimonas pinastri]SEQ91502.1 CDP-paratose 2-epimerase [Faunimonas pinastri]